MKSKSSSHIAVSTSEENKEDQAAQSMKSASNSGISKDNSYNPVQIEQKWPHSATASRGKQEYNPIEIEAFWQKKWLSEKTFTPSLQTADKPYFTLMMFPYPSAEGLHVGNMYAFTGSDVHARWKRMMGSDVFVPIGLDGFGIHSENYALKVGKHPLEQAKISQKNFYRQLRATGNSYDWTRTLETYDPLYYRWTQWIFTQMFKMGLAYRKKATVNWCPSDKTVLADEQVIDGKCERDGAIVEKRDLEQWFFKITAYSDRLLSGLDKIDWPDKIKIAQRQWIGKSEGARLKFALKKIPGQPDGEHSVEIFTTRPDTLFGATFLVISPELAKKWLDVGWKAPEEVVEYINSAFGKDQSKRKESKEKTGVDAQIMAVNPVNNEEIPVWISDYVLAEYGTGAIMAVPAHDERDFEFAKKFNLPIRQVIAPDSEFEKLSSGKPQKPLEAAYAGSGGLINSGPWDDFAVPQALPKILLYIEEKGIGKSEANYHLRDWLISRQRYWGPPIPMIFCSNCSENGKGERGDMPGWYTVSQENLPVALPDVEDWRPEGSGASPLANHPEFYETTCPSCGEKARRETDVSDTFLDSAWYYLRYLSIGSSDPERENSMPYDIDILKKWTPAAIYIGGAEHSVLHLLYVRFVAMVLHDLKSSSKFKVQSSKLNSSELITTNEVQSSRFALHFEEPFPRFFGHGLIIKDGAKMSKSRGNVVVPDQYIGKFGADTLRLYLMFLGPFSHGGEFRDTGIEGMFRFVRRVWNLFDSKEFTTDSNDMLRMINSTVKDVTLDFEKFSFNTAIAKLMEFYNFISDSKESWSRRTAVSYLKLFAPLAPHFTEELWQRLMINDLGLKNENLGSEKGLESKKDSFSRLNRDQNDKINSIHFSSWPAYDEKYLVADEVVIPIQVNGKRRGEITVESSKIKDQAQLEERARENIKSHLSGQTVRKVIYVPGKIINFVV